jgi:hypothetical protein
VETELVSATGKKLPAERLKSPTVLLNSAESKNHGDLANYTPDNLGDLGGEVIDALLRQYHDHRVRRSYFKTAKLRL